MSDPRILELLGAIARQTTALQGIYDSLERAMESDVKVLNRSANAAVMVAGLLDNYYTCLETSFVRISHFFENSVAAERWRSELLDKMALEIPGVRIAAVSQENYANLVELLKFRHFRRYYFELQYDWDRLEFLVRKLRQAHPIVRKDLARFEEFLKSL